MITTLIGILRGTNLMLHILYLLHILENRSNIGIYCTILYTIFKVVTTHWQASSWFADSDAGPGS